MSHPEDHSNEGRRWHEQPGNENTPKSKAEQSKTPQQSTPPRAMPGDAVVSLTPQGRDFYNQLLEAASIEAGRTIVAKDLLEVLRRVRDETGQSDPQFSDPAILACFKKHLRALGDKHSQ